MYYLLIKTSIGKVDLGLLGVHYRTKKEAERMAEVARTLKDVEEVQVLKKQAKKK